MADASDVESLIAAPLFDRSQAAKEARLFPVLRRQLESAVAACPELARLAERQHWALDRCATIADLPFFPVSMFKHFELRMVPSSQIVRELRSSGTTTQRPSRILLDRTTAFRQARALSLLFADSIGSGRRPFLVIDVPSSASPELSTLSARGAAIRGLAPFATDTAFALAERDGRLEVDAESVSRFLADHAGEDLLVFGFTFIVWQHFVLEAERAGLRWSIPRGLLLHSGGWKKLAELEVSKKTFAERAASVLGLAPADVRDFYGMVEAVGVVFVDCEAGNKHCPAFADVLIRDPLTLAPRSVGESGLIEVVSALPTSYPGHALGTEDLGRIMAIDDCACGRSGLAFQFESRVERAELRGCGDVHAQVRELR